ncbi:fimbria/pilus outer membrane usher protein [Escherichia coli]
MHRADGIYTLECNERRRYRSRKLSGGINPVELVSLPDLTVSSQISTSQDTKDSLQGQKYRLDANYNLPFSLGLTTSLTRSDRHYRELSEAIDDDYTDPTKALMRLV